MEVQNKKGWILWNHLALFLVMLMLLDSSFSCGATVLVKSNSSFRCDGLEECMIAEDLDLEFLMNPYVSRILATQSLGTGALNANKQAVKPCGKRDPQYAKCIKKPPNPNHHQCLCKGGYCKPCRP